MLIFSLYKIVCCIIFRDLYIIKIFNLGGEAMSKVIDLSKSVYELSKENPEIIEVMKELGFDNIANPAMLNTMGKFMTIPKGAAMKKIDLNLIKDNFAKRGYTILE
jgi:hypothetical protein